MTFAHAGHWLLDLLYAAPLLIMVGLLGIARLRERRSRGGADERRHGGRGADGVVRQETRARDERRH